MERFKLNKNAMMVINSTRMDVLGYAIFSHFIVVGVSHHLVYQKFSQFVEMARYKIGKIVMMLTALVEMDALCLAMLKYLTHARDNLQFVHCLPPQQFVEMELSKLGKLAMIEIVKVVMGVHLHAR